MIHWIRPTEKMRLNAEGGNEAENEEKAEEEPESPEPHSSESKQQRIKKLTKELNQLVKSL